MRLCSFTANGSVKAGVVDGDAVIDLSVAAPDLPPTVGGILHAGATAIGHAREAASKAAARLPLSEVSLTAPVRPSKFFAVGLNYADHVAEAGVPTPEELIVFSKAISCVVGPYDAVHRPSASQQLDYEGELGIVIGTRCRHVPAAEASQVIAGYLVVNDVSARDWQLKTPQWVLGKSFDTHGPIGPWIVTPDELGDPHDLSLRTLVNGEARQDTNTANLIFDCFKIIEIISTVCTLEPGDVIATGTSGGVAGAMEGQPWLVPGDVVRVEIDGIGAIENTIVQEPMCATHQW